MQDKTSKNRNSNSNSEDSIKNEEYLLGFSSKYKSNIYNGEDIEEDINQFRNESELNKLNKKLSLDSTSITNSQENNITELRNDLNPSDFYDVQRKMSSPLFDYLKGSDIYLSQIHQRTIDIRHSHNFVRRDIFFKTNKKNNINANQNDNDRKETKSNETKKLKKISNSYNTKMPNKNNINNVKNYNNNNYINNNFLLTNNNYPQQIFNINYINLNDFNNDPRINNNLFNKRKMSYNIESAFIENYFNNILNNNNNNYINNPSNQKQQNNPNLNMYFSYNVEPNNNISGIVKKVKNKKKPFDRRKGDWNCPECNNLNFAFRINCNRCKFPKPNKLKDDED